jgi:2-amino-4-hydroxy-6-hydroxymethyldihydropteridine diphosphokinase
MPRTAISKRAIAEFVKVNALVLGLGANIRGSWGNPRETLLRARRELEAAGMEVVRCSNFYLTQPVGLIRQPRYLNAVVVARANIAPTALLRLAKQIERRAGRRSAPPMSPRPLDIDIIDYGGRRIGRPAEVRRRGTLILPHPELQKRAFVLQPLSDAAPAWQHPRWALSAKALLAQLNPSLRRGVTLDSVWKSCDKGSS